MPSDQLRIVFTGIGGVRKVQAIKNFMAFLCARDSEWQRRRDQQDDHLRESRERELFGFYDAEEHLKGRMAEFLEATPPNRPEMWRRSFLAALDKWEATDPPPRYSFFSMHMTFLTQSQFVSPLSWITYQREHHTYEHTMIEGLRKFDPQYLITLIDNVHVTADAAKRRGYRLRLSDMMRWRDVEALMTDTAAYLLIRDALRRDGIGRYPFEHSPVIAVRHPTKMLASYLLESERPRVYASFPITGPRKLAEEQGNDSAIREINAWRARLHDEFTVFDPVTIDEIPLQRLNRASQPMLGTKVGSKVIRWLRRQADKTETPVFPASASWPSLEGVEVLCGAESRDIEVKLGEVE